MLVLLDQDVESLHFVHLRDQWLARLLALDRLLVIPALDHLSQHHLVVDQLHQRLDFHLLHQRHRHLLVDPWCDAPHTGGAGARR